jgi:hypothetical protein
MMETEKARKLVRRSAKPLLKSKKEVKPVIPPYDQDCEKFLGFVFPAEIPRPDNWLDLYPLQKQIQ